MNKTFKIISLCWMILIITALMSACGGGSNQQPADTKEKAETHNDAKFNDNELQNDAQYLVDAYSAGLYEIESAKHAREKASNKAVKDLAGKVIEEHVNLNDKLKNLAEKKQVTLQAALSEEQLEDIKECNAKKGSEYDKAFLDKMVETHKKSVSMFEKAAEKSGDQDIRNLFNDALSSIRGHLDMAMNVRDRMQ